MTRRGRRTTVERVECFACGRDVELGTGERVAFRDVCPGCGADLHACRNCAHHDPGAYNECREPQAEQVGDRERANRCDYFAPGASTAGGVPGREREQAMAKLEGLFKKS